jgi:CheY-like chemotaxis protein
MGEIIKPTALVVEDDEDQRSLVSLLLEESELNVVECATAQEAADAIEHLDHDLDIVIADVNLEGGHTGLEVVALARRRFPNCKVFITTGGARPSLPRDVVFLQKPWRSLDLLRHIATVSQIHH